MKIDLKFYKISSIFNVRLIGGGRGQYLAINHVCAKTKKDALKICEAERGKSELSNPRDHYYTKFYIDEIDFKDFMMVQRAYHTLYQFENSKNELIQILYDNLTFPYDYCDSYQGYYLRESGIVKLGLK